MTKEALKAAVLALAEKKRPDLSGLPLHQWAADNIKALKAEAQAVTVIPLPASRDWSAHDPGGMDHYIHACIQASRDKIAEPFEAGRLACGCPLEIADAYRADPRFPNRFQQLTHETIYLANLPAAMESAMQDGAYAVDRMRQAAPKDDLSDDEKRRAAAYASMGPAELRREIQRRRKILDGFDERLSAGRSPPPERIAQIQHEVVSVMDPPKRGPSAAEP